MQRQGRYVFSDTEVRIELEKEIQEDWPVAGTYPSKEEARRLREEAEAEFREFCVNTSEEKKTKKAEREKKSVSLCIEKDEKRRDNIDGMKKTILDSLGSKEPIQNVGKSANKENEKSKSPQTFETDEEKSRNVENNLSVRHENKINKTINKIQQSYSIELAKQIAVENEAIKKSNSIPPRSFGKIDVKFTKRDFRHPARESKKEEEEQWLRQQAKAQQRKQKVKDDLQMDHSEIVKKCSHFFKVDDFESAEEVLNCGIELFPKSSQLFSNRAAVRLKTGNLFGSLEDSEKALDLLLPEVEKNKSSRAAVRCRRALALQKLGKDVEALIELEIAGKLLPDNEKIQSDIESLRSCINSRKTEKSEEEDEEEEEGEEKEEEEEKKEGNNMAQSKCEYKGKRVQNVTEGRLSPESQTENINIAESSWEELD